MTERKELTVQAMEIIAIWSKIDAVKADLLSMLLNTERSKALAMYQAVKSPAAQSAMLFTAARHGIDNAKDLELFGYIFKIIEASNRRRNEFAHHIWAVSKDLPDALLLIDPRSMVTREKAEQEYADGLRETRPPLFGHDLDKVAVYRLKDFSESLNAATYASWIISALALVIGFDNDESRQLLWAEPAIQRLAQAQSQGKNP